MLDATTEGIKERLCELRSVHPDITNIYLSERCNVSIQAVGQWFSSGRIHKKNTGIVAECYRVRLEWLLIGAPPKRATNNAYYDNSEPGPDAMGLVPVISWVQAGEWQEVADHFMPGDAGLPCPTSHSANTYALRVIGDSMTSSMGRSYPEGAIIYVDPDQRGGVESGDRVIAKINGDNMVTFKVFVKDGQRKYLKPLNPQYPIITDEFRILGKVIGVWME